VSRMCTGVGRRVRGGSVARTYSPPRAEIDISHRGAVRQRLQGAVSLDRRRPRSTPYIASDDEDATDRE